MLSTPKLQVRAESLPLLRNVLRPLHLSLTFLSNLMELALDFILISGVKLLSLLVFQSEAPEIDLADLE